MGAIGSLLANKVTWIVLIVGAIVLISWGQWIHPWLTTRALDISGARAAIVKVQKEAEQAKQETAQAQKAIEAMTLEIARQKAIAESARRETARYAAEEKRWRGEAERLGSLVAKLEADRRALPAIKTRQQELAELKRLGY